LALLKIQATCRAFEVIGEYNSENTLLAHKGDLIYWQAWLSAIEHDFICLYRERYYGLIMMHTEEIKVSIDEVLVNQGYKLKKGPHKLATIKRRIGSLSVFLDRAKWPIHAGIRY